MPYFKYEALPEWAEAHPSAELEEMGIPPPNTFEYATPWQAETTVMSFPTTPGEEPKIPDQRVYAANVARPIAKRGVLARLFGRRPPSIAPVPTLTPEQREDSVRAFLEKQKAASEHALWAVSTAAARFRGAGVKRIVGTYDGGGDESFTCFQFMEMNDGRRIDVNEIAQVGLEQFGLEDLIYEAAAALMGKYDAGEFILQGALTVDVDACTITDEKDAATVFAFANRN